MANRLSTAVRIWPARRSGHRSLLVLALGFLFLWQGWILQTHVHPSPAPGPTALHYNVAQTGGASNGDGPIDCKICQANLVAGSYVGPAPALLGCALLSGTIGLLAIAIGVPVSAFSHDWRGRAPPRLRARSI